MKNFKKLYVSLIIMFALCLPFLTGCTSKISSIEIISGINTTISFGDDLEYDDLEILVNFENGTSSIVKYSEFAGYFTIDDTNIISTQSGEYEITVTYKDVSTVLTVTVTAAHVTGFEVITTNMDLNVGYGTTPDWERLIVKAIYADNSKVELASTEYFLNTGSFNPTRPGEYEITVGYSTFGTSTFTITVLSASQTGITADVTGVQTNIIYGATPDFSALKVYAKFSDNSELLLTSNQYTIDTNDFSKTIPGTYTITISHNTFTTTFTVTVAAAHVTGFEIDRTAIPTQVVYGSEIDWSDLIVRAVYADNSKIVLSEGDYTLNNTSFNNNIVGTYTIYVTYLTFDEQTFTIKVVSASSTDGSFAYEGETLILFSNVSYTFSSVTDLKYKKDGETEFINVVGDTLTLTDLGYYILSYKKNNVQTTKNIKIVPWISTFGVGSSIITYNNNIAQNSAFLNSNEITPYCVGTENLFYFDININGGHKTSLEYIVYDFKVFDEEDGFVVVDNLILSTTQNETLGAGFQFNNYYNDKVIRVTIRPTFNDRAPIIFEFVLNNGYNVFTNEQLKYAFGNLAIQKINIARGIEVSLSENQTNPDGSPRNYLDLLNYVEYNGDELIANNTGNPYVRYSESKTGDNLVINGNYQTIDASNLKLINLDYSGLEDGQPGTLKDTEGVVNSQIAIFRSEVRDATIAVTDAMTSEEYNNLNNNTITYNNLLVVGNTITPSTTQGNQLYENSGSHSGIRSSHADLTTNNCIIKNSCIALFVTRTGTDLYANYTKLYECWANLIYGHASNLVALTNSDLGNAGGSAVWLTDTNELDGELYNPKFIMDTNTVIENFVSGSEAWFVAQKMAPLVTQLKAQIDGAAPYGKTILKHYNYDGQDVEKFNFTIVIHEELDDVATGKMSGSMQIGNILVEREWGTFPVEAESLLFDETIFSTQEFYERVDYYMGLGLDQESAQQAAALDYCYHMEIVQKIPVIGNIHIIMWLYDTSN